MKTVSKHYGFYRAEVRQLLNNGFCRLRIPDILEPIDDNVNTLPLAEPAQTIGGGAETLNGTFVYPELGSIVWCFFEGGNLERPVYFATSNVRCPNWGNVSIPTQQNTNEGNDGYTVMPAGQLSRFNKTLIQQKIIRDEQTGIPSGDEIDIKVETTAQQETMYNNALNSGSGGSDSMPTPVAALVHLDNKRNIVSITAKDSIILHAPHIVIDSTGFEKSGTVLIKSHDIENITDNGHYRVFSSHVNIDAAGNNIIIQTRLPGDVQIIDPLTWGRIGEVLGSAVAAARSIAAAASAISNLLGKAGSSDLSNVFSDSSLMDSLSDVPVTDVLNKLDEAGILSGLDDATMDELLSEFGETPVEEALGELGDLSAIPELTGKTLNDILQSPSSLSGIKDKLSDVFTNMNNLVDKVSNLGLKDVLEKLSGTNLNDLMDKVNGIAGLVGGIKNFADVKKLVSALNDLSEIVPDFTKLTRALEIIGDIKDSIGDKISDVLSNMNQISDLIGGVGKLGDFFSNVVDLNNILPDGLSSVISAISNLNSLDGIAGALANIPGIGNIATALASVNKIADMVGNIHSLKDALNCASTIAGMIPGGFGGNILSVVNNISSVSNLIGGLGNVSSIASIVGGLGGIGGAAGTIGSLTSLAGTFAAMTPMGMATMVGAQVLGSVVSKLMKK